MPALPLDLIDTSARTHRRLFTELSPGHLELCIDNSTLERALTCPRSYELYAVLGRDVGERDALNYGSAMHAALECFYLGGTVTDMIDIVMSHFQKNPCSENSWRNADHALEACRRYVKWRQQMPTWEVAELDGKPAVEIPFKLPLFSVGIDDESIEYSDDLVVAVNPENNVHRPFRAWHTIDVFWTGKIDLIRRTSDGKLRPVDHKTTSIGGQTFWSAFDLSCQMMGYCWATQKITGVEIEGVDIDCLIGRAPTRTGISHDNEWQPFNYTQDQLFEWKEDVIAHIRRIIDCLLTGYFPKSTTHCANKYGMCPYHDVCKQPSKDTAARILMSGMYAEKKWNPLEKHT